MTFDQDAPEKKIPAKRIRPKERENKRTTGSVGLSRNQSRLHIEEIESDKDRQEALKIRTGSDFLEEDRLQTTLSGDGIGFEMTQAEQDQLDEFCYPDLDTLDLDFLK